MNAKLDRRAMSVAASSISTSNWRAYVRKRVGGRGERIFDVLADLMEGRVITPRDDAGRMMEPIVPTPATMLQAAMYLGDMMFGKATSQTEQVAAEAEASRHEALRALSDEELKLRVKKHLESEVTDAELVEDTQAALGEGTVTLEELEESLEERPTDIRRLARLAWESSDDE